MNFSDRPINDSDNRYRNRPAMCNMIERWGSGDFVDKAMAVYGMGGEWETWAQVDLAFHLTFTNGFMRRRSKTTRVQRRVRVYQNDDLRGDILYHRPRPSAWRSRRRSAARHKHDIIEVRCQQKVKRHDEVAALSLWLAQVKADIKKIRSQSLKNDYQWAARWLVVISVTRDAFSELRKLDPKFMLDLDGQGRGAHVYMWIWYFDQPPY